MSQSPSHLINTKHLEKSQLRFFFEKAKLFKQILRERKSLDHHVDLDLARSKVVLLFFLEPSTRTRVSFEIAARRLGLNVVLFADRESTSLAKGETPSDSFLNLLAMRPDLVVVRHGQDPDLAKEISKSPVPVVSAGQASESHPTQALLDVFTVEESFGTCEGKNILFVGDTFFGRAARSSMELFHHFGARVGYVSPEGMAYDGAAPTQSFTSLPEALPWADVVVGLRAQTERLPPGVSFSRETYAEKFRLDPSSLRSLKSNALILHPGPFVPMVDLDPTILKDPRCQIHAQVENGVYIRMAVLSEYLRIWRTH